MKTVHKSFFSDARNLQDIKDDSVDLVITSPPYPMIEMWDEQFVSFNPEIGKALESRQSKAFWLMHTELDKAWKELYRVVKTGGFVCINIGNATRSIKGRFKLYINNARIALNCASLGFDPLPEILWRKQTNAPNKFMGSGMLPAGAYVTLEHEYILIFRKGGKRTFLSNDEKDLRRKSAFFWEERNAWFSDTWDFKGTKQEIIFKGIKKRSAAFPFELAKRLISMYSIQGDTILDPFWGTGTTTLAAMALQRNSIGIEINEYFDKILFAGIEKPLLFLNNVNDQRLKQHANYIQNRISEKGQTKHTNAHYNFPVMTSAESYIIFNKIIDIEDKQDNSIAITYQD